ncbi:hypothetical protein DPMN_106806 [Dreissena polymorpha]|uniref:Uncharacterized protein n=1 Tax=Dreissena polymorpha TaxID=45954 RepID=A0A9D4K5L2_DREPO|nr:hypothetical protein DPMN_106806 [Dreissena polymorpha]
MGRVPTHTAPLCTGHTLRWDVLPLIQTPSVRDIPGDGTCSHSYSPPMYGHTWRWDVFPLIQPPSVRDIVKSLTLHLVKRDLIGAFLKYDITPGAKTAHSMII